MQSVSVVGTWNLISAKAQNPNDDVMPLYGEDPSGMLMYDAKGYMFAVFMRPVRSRFVSGDPLGGTSEEIKEAFEGFDAYCGTYEVNAEKRTVTHHVKDSRFPNWEGTDQLRYFEFSGTRLILKTAPIPALGTEWIVSLIWEQMA
jgi:hypothetical protein